MILKYKGSKLDPLYLLLFFFRVEISKDAYTVLYLHLLLDFHRKI